MPAQLHPSADLNMTDSWSPCQTDSSGFASGSSSSSPNNSSNEGDTPNARITSSLDGVGSTSLSKSKLKLLSRDSSSSSRPKTHYSSRSSSSRRSKLKSHRNHQMACHDCGTTDTPQWRVGVDGPGTLCNVCGLLFSKRTQRHIAQFY